ncbi:MAG TPA: enoyl-CoA hydratase/isomerase family protein [Bryobacteraceae bacterium]
MSLIVEREGRVLHLRLNRSEKRNALNTKVCAAIANAVQAAQDDPRTGCILLSAAGKAFSAGMDLDEAMHGADLESVHEELFTMGINSLKPIVVSVNGAALGGGLGLVAQGHIVIASEEATFGLTEIRLGLWPFLIYRSVEAALGARRTLELSLTGRVFLAQDALNWGLVHRVCPAAEAADQAHAIARDLAKASPAAIAAGMRYWRESRDKSWKEAGELAGLLRKKLFESGDLREGYTAFKEKREPHWPLP